MSREENWTDNSIRNLSQEKDETYKCIRNSNNNKQHFENAHSLQSQLGVSTEASKQRY